MERKQFVKFENKTLISRGEKGKVYRLEDGIILKRVSKLVLNEFKKNDVDFESKICNPIAKKVSSIVSPIEPIYEGRNCTSYTMEDVEGISLKEYDQNLSLFDRQNLRKYLELFSKIEEALIEANQNGIVIPDLCTYENIIITPDGKIKFLDYDGMQIGRNDKTIVVSDYVQDFVVNPSKKFSKIPDSKHYTKELDKTSFLILAFLIIFNVDLTTVGKFNPATGNIISLKCIFDLLEIDDPELYKKVEDTLSLNRSGFYIMKDLMRLLDKYELQVLYYVKDGKYAKKLYKK